MGAPEVQLDSALAKSSTCFPRRTEVLRFTTAGSVDDGKSTLIGRLLYDSKNVYEDQLASVGTAESIVQRARWTFPF